MAGNLHVRNLDYDLIARLKRRAARHVSNTGQRTTSAGYCRAIGRADTASGSPNRSARDSLGGIFGSGEHFEYRPRFPNELAHSAKLRKGFPRRSGPEGRIEFIDENGRGSGVRLRKRQQKKKT